MGPTIIRLYYLYPVPQIRVVHASSYTPCQIGQSVFENKLHIRLLHLAQCVYLYAFFENQEQFQEFRLSNRITC